MKGQINSPMKKYVVYRIMNIYTNTVYIGSTTQFEIRKAEHLGALRANKHDNYFLQRAFNEYKEHAFTFDILFDSFANRDEMLLKEYEVILQSKDRYNIDVHCPAVSGGHTITRRGKRVSKSVERHGGLLIGLPEARDEKVWYDKNGRRHKKTGKKEPVKKPKMTYPIFDAIIERRKQIEANKARIQSQLENKNS